MQNRTLMFLYNLLFIGMTNSIVYSMVNPGQNLELPGDVLDAIRCCRDPRKTEELTRRALFAYYLCDKYKTMDRDAFERFIDGYQEWGRDPMRSSKFKASSPEKFDKEYYEYLAKEKESIFKDCQKCTMYKKQLSIYLEFNRLENPKDVLDAIKKFKKSINNKDKNDSCYKVNHPEEYMQDARTAEKLVRRALFAYYVCDDYNTMDRSEFEAFISKYQTLNMQDANFKADCEKLKNKDNKFVDKERENILKDYEWSASCKKQLSIDIESLQNMILYRKNNGFTDEQIKDLNERKELLRSFYDGEVSIEEFYSSLQEMVDKKENSLNGQPR